MLVQAVDLAQTWASAPLIQRAAGTTGLSLAHAPWRSEEEFSFVGQEIQWQRLRSTLRWEPRERREAGNFAPRLPCPAPWRSWEFCGSAPMFKGPDRTFAHTCLSCLLANAYLSPTPHHYCFISFFLLNSPKVILGPEGVAYGPRNHTMPVALTKPAASL